MYVGFRVGYDFPESDFYAMEETEIWILIHLKEDNLAEVE